MLNAILSPSIDFDSKNWLNYVTVKPDGQRLGIIDGIIKALKGTGIWFKFDALWFLAAHDSQAACLNWKNPATYTLTPVNSPIFTIDRGYQGNGTSSYLNTNFNFNTNGVNFTLNNASLGVYSRTNLAQNNRVDIGVADTLLQGRTGSNVSAIRVNQSNADGASVSDSLGLMTPQRNTSNELVYYKNGVLVTTISRVSSIVPNYNCYIGARNNLGVADSFSTRQIAMAFIGGVLTSTQHAQLYTIVQRYMTYLGANV